MIKFNNSTNIAYDQVLGAPIRLGVGLKVLPTEGNLVYEYNPFRNYRLSQTSYYYKNRIFSPKELLIELGLISVSSQLSDEDCLSMIGGYSNWDGKVPSDQEDPVLIEEGELTNFETDSLGFDINHPVSVLPQYSYDNSVNLVINDGKNVPRLINSRFSATSKNKYQIVDRKGNNDTNIYDQGDQFDIDTSLYKRTVEIPNLRFVGIIGGGQLPIGNYHFYFRYCDADGNETDFVAESSLVSMFIGTTPSSIRSGFREENSHKGVQFILSNIDASYQYVNVYYTRSSSDINQNASVRAFKINQKYLVNNALKCNVIVTGFEESSEISIDEINPTYLLASSIEAQASCQNMLMIGNIQKPEIPYKELEDISLRFLPYTSSSNYDLDIDPEYNVKSVTLGYYDPKFIYNNVGYWNHEYYRFGVVYILPDSSLSPVFNIRGIEKLNNNPEFSQIPMFDDKGNRNYIVVEEDTYKIVTDKKSYSEGINIIKGNKDLENSKGVVSLEADFNGIDQPIHSIGIRTNQEVLKYLQDKLGIKGMFFVRQKRIPTILCQAYTIGIDTESKTPVLPIGSKEYIAERFIDDDRNITHDFQSRLYKFSTESKIRKEAAICPEYDVDSSYLNSLFTGESFAVQESDIQPNIPYLTQFSERSFYAEGKNRTNSSSKYNTRIIGVEDNTKLVAIGDKMFSARAGEAEEAFRFEYLEKQNKVTESSNLIRGSFGPYLGITGFPYVGKLIDIRIPNFFSISEENTFKIRYNDKSPFYAISDRISLSKSDDYFQSNGNGLQLINPLNRGDCYICQFTHRLNRNFQDPSAPINDQIVDPKCWKDNFEVSDGVIKSDKFEDINLGDINAVKLGMWVTFTVRSTKNLNIRSTDDSIVDETSLTGHPRTFYPYGPCSPDGVYKTPEALCYNKGFEKSLSERYNFEVPDVPALKNDFTNRIAYSDKHVNDAFKNGFRVFQGTHYRDYPKTYGSIIQLVEFRGNLICVFEHGVALIPVNERAVAGEGQGGNVYINTSNVLPENPKVLSDTFGSQWKESVIKTPYGVYGVDTVAKKIWRTNGTEFECISDFKVQEFLNNNISLTEREVDPVIGIRNVKTHYNKFKRDVMFTFYDNLYGFEEKVWNLCYNELQQKWITFYSWVPSYSENIYNSFFSFDRNTSKWISKLGISKRGSSYADGVTLDDNIIYSNSFSTGISLSNRTLPQGDGINVQVQYELVPDIYGNYKNFQINGNTLIFTGSYNSIKSELYERDPISGKIKKDDSGRKILLQDPINREKIVILLNIKANIKVTYSGINPGLGEAYSQGFTNGTSVDAGYYQSVVALIPKYNMQFLTTDFWKHGQSGIIDISDKINPAYWYGKQHPFEFEFIVADNPQLHKIFDNLEIISNNAEPESFHYEVVGDCYQFAKDKKNMYIRQEATKELYQSNGCDISFDRSYIDLREEHRPLKTVDGSVVDGMFDKSTLLPLYYSRQDTINEIEDSYHLKDNISTKDFSALSGAEVVRYSNSGEYRIWNHAKAVDLNYGGRIRGNMQYKEDKWNVQINPLNIVQKNERQWGSQDLGGRTNLNTSKIPIEIGQSPIPNEVLDYNEGQLNIPDNSIDRAIVSWNWQDSQLSEAKLKDKWIKIRVRYKGDKLAVISAIKTLYSISYS